MYVGFVDLEKAYMEELWQVPRMYDVCGKLLNDIKSLVYFRVKGCERDCFRVDSGVREEFIMSP